MTQEIVSNWYLGCGCQGLGNVLTHPCENHGSSGRSLVDKLDAMSDEELEDAWSDSARQPKDESRSADLRRFARAIVAALEAR